MASVNKDELEEKIQLAASLYTSEKKSIPDIDQIAANHRVRAGLMTWTMIFRFED